MSDYSNLKNKNYKNYSYLRVVFLGNLYGKGPSFAGALFDRNNLCPTITTCQGGNREPMIIEVKNE